MMMNYIDAALQTSFSGASSISMWGSVGIMLHQEAWSERLFDKDFIDQLLPVMQRRL
jgi:hypothetical protein